jgi:hypothetical protein
MVLPKAQQYLQQLVENDKPARMIGLFTGHALRARDVERLVTSCVTAMKEEDGAAALTLIPLGEEDPRCSWRLTVFEGAAATPQDCLVQVFDMKSSSSPHRAMLDHIGQMDEELSLAASHLQETALTFLQIASGKLDHHDRIHPFENLVSLFTSALGAAIVDPAAAIVTNDPAEWADALEQSLLLEADMGALHR